MNVELGLIEGYYGTPWSWSEREAVLARLAPDYGFYLYAPKADAWLRRRWQEPHPDDVQQALARFAASCRSQGVRFGVGLSPYEVYLGFDAAAQDALARKLEAFDALGIADLALLFDDMRGDVPDLAAKQAEIVHWAAERSAATRILVCPSYYSDDPVLDRVFGQRDPGYLAELGRLLAPEIEIFWTGEEVCSRAFSPGHLQRVTQEMGRKPFIWDNYPVNDGQRMSQYLYLRGFTGRPAAMAEHIAAHGINPALQPTLACIPALTLIDSYREGDAYAYRAAGLRAAQAVLGPELGEQLHNDVLTLQDIGLDRLAEKADSLRQTYARFEHAGAQEVLRWLDGAYRITHELVQTQ
ncbi:MAG: beta-N-acetylglucosaminidase domain-containing protein [Candidatus Sericytochromatia bacterium]